MQSAGCLSVLCIGNLGQRPPIPNFLRSKTMNDSPPPGGGLVVGGAIDKAIKWARSEGLSGSPLITALKQVRTENRALRKRLAWFETRYQRDANE